MKKILFVSLLVIFCACGGQRENVNEVVIQKTTKVTIANIAPPLFCHYQDGEMFATETETIREGILTDTINLYSPLKSLDAIVQQTNSMFLKLSDDLYNSFTDSSYTRYVQTYKVRLNEATCLSTKLYTEEIGINGNSYQGEYGRVRFYAKEDTVYSITIPDPTGGFSAEGMTFTVSGDEVKNVEASYSMRYTAMAIKKHSSLRDGYCTAVCDFVTDELPLSVEVGSYTLPIVKTLEMITTDWQKMEELRPEAIKKWEAWSGEKMDTTNLTYLFELDYFLVNLSVTYADGSVRNYHHVALSDYHEP